MNNDSPHEAAGLRIGGGGGRWLLAVALITGCWFFFIQVPWHSDDAGMMLVASSFASLKAFWYSHYSHQLAINLPLMAMMKVFGYGTTAYYAFAYVSYGLFVFSIMLLGDRLLFAKSRVGSFVAVIIVLGSHLAGQAASIVTSDYLPSALIILSFVCFMKSQELAGRERNRYILYAALLGFGGYSAKISVAPFLLAIPAYDYFNTRRLNSTIRFGVYFAACLVGECVFNWILHGNPFIRFKIFTSAAFSQSNIAASASLTDFLLRVPKGLWEFKDGKILLSLGPVGVVLAMFTLSRRVVFSTVAGAFALFSIYAYPVTSLHPITPAVNFVPRHYLVVYGVLAIFCAYTIVCAATLLQRVLRINKNAWIVVMTSVVAVFLFQYHFYAYSPDKLIVRGAEDKYATVSHDFVEYLKQHGVPEGQVYTLAEKNFRLYQGFNELDILDGERAPAPDAPTYVLSSYYDINFYTDLFAALRNYEVVEKFQRLARTSPSAYPLFRSGDIFLHKVDAWPTESTLVAGPSPLGRKLDVQNAAAEPEGDALLLTSTAAPGESASITVMAFLASADGVPFPPGGYGVDCEAEVDAGASMRFRVLRQGENGPEVIDMPLQVFDFERPAGADRYVMHRLRDFRTTVPGDTACVEVVVENSKTVLLKGLSIRRYIVPDADASAAQ